MTFEEMQYLVHTVTRDYSKEFITDDDVEVWLNQGARKVAERTKVLTKTLLSTDAGAAQFTGGRLLLEPDVLDIKNLRLGDYDDIDFDVLEDDWWAAKDNGSIPIPAWGRVWAGYVEVFPEPEDSVEYQMRYVAAPDVMVEPNDICELPVALHDKVVFWAKAEAYYKLRETTEGDREFARFEIDLPPEDISKYRNQPRPITIGYKKGPFDTYDATHRG